MNYSRRYRLSLSGIVVLLPLVLTAAQIDSSFYPSIEGWKRSDTIKAFTPENLYDFIDGAADAYLMQNFERLTVAYYTRGDSSVTVEIYRHRTEENTYGIYSQERTSDVELLPIGIEGYYAESVLNFVIGRTYVKLTSYSLGSHENKILQMVARAVAVRIGGTTKRPAVFDCFPAEGLTPKSERFVGRDFLGYEFFRSGYIADYRIDSTTFQMFIMTAGDTASRDSSIASYVRKLGLSSIPASVRDPYWGTITFRTEGPAILGIVGALPDETAARMLDEMQAHFRVLNRSH